IEHRHPQTLLPDGKLWIGTQEGLDIFDPGIGRVLHTERHDPSNPQSLAANAIRALLYSSDGMLYVGTIGGGLNIFHPPSKTWKRFVPDNTRSYSISGNQVRTLCEDPITKKIWVGLGIGGGLNLFDPRTERFEHFRHIPSVPHTLSNGSVRSLFVDSTGTLWVGTMNGLNKFDRTTQTFTVFDERTGLPNSVIYGILEDSRGWLWLSTNKGLLHFNPSTRIYHHYEERDGLQSNEFNGAALCKGADGILYFGGVEGYTAFHPDSIRRSTTMPLIQISQLLVLGQSINLDSALSSDGTLQLDYRQNFFSIEFAALDYSDPVYNRYSYKLEGLEQAWVNSGSRRIAIYTAVPPGTYTFRARGTNSDGIWSNHELQLTIIIAPPFWQTWWFYAAILCILSIAVWRVYVWRIASIERENRILEAMVAERTEALREANEELMAMNQTLHQQNEQLALLNEEKNEFLGIAAHDLKNPLGAIMNYVYMLQDDTSPIDPEVRATFLHNILSSAEQMFALVSNLLDINAIERGGLSLELIAVDVAMILAQVIERYQARAETKNIQLVYDSSYKLYARADEQYLMQVFDNIVSNAIKYLPPNKRVMIRCFQRAQNVRVEVRDEGPGLSSEDMNKLFGKFARLSARPTGGEHSTGLGLSIVKRLVEAMDGRVWCESKLGHGATFIVELRASDVYYNIRSDAATGQL
ncbi:MAG: ATP-binding protein, partial [Bacteroidota bacterium]|nr:ATP-binding protein [Candidatus Kapabacteria bacterium]MDW8220717.1 ATP-binding protein [Bacteroidota bacterium]